MGAMLQQDVVIKAPTLLPFSSRHIDSCPRCGYKIRLIDRVIAALRGGMYASHSVKFCEGGKELESACGPGGLLGEIVGVHTHVNPCAGIVHPHLHLACNRCGFRKLMETRS